MAHKKKRDRILAPKRQKGSARNMTMLSIVATDSTFELVSDIDIDGRKHSIWIGKCIHCNTKLSVSTTGDSMATIEHINPLCNGGSGDDLKNLALACARCNNEKGVRHDRYAGSNARSGEVIASLVAKRNNRWCASKSKLG